MKDGTKDKTRKGQRQIVSVSFPVPVFEELDEFCTVHCCNRSELVSKAVAAFLSGLVHSGEGDN